MKEMKAAGSIEYKGKEYNLVFNLNVMEEIQEEYGSIEKWGALCEVAPGKEPSVKALKYGLGAMINEALDIENEEKGLSQEPLSLKKIGRIISELGIGEAAKALSNTVVKSTKSNPKNESSTKKKK